MPLYSLKNLKKPVEFVPHKREYAIRKKRLTITQLRRITKKLNSMIKSDEVHTSSWMPGHYWSGTVFHPILVRACRRNEDAAAKCFGLLLWEVMMARREDWSFGRFEKDNIPIEGLTYFKIHRKK
jgi:hypothetical protein